MTLVVDRRSVALGSVTLVDEFSLELQTGTVHAVVGESGSGKSLAALSTLELLPNLQTSGTVTLDGARVEGRRGMAMVLQEPMTALNPVLRVGDQVIETIRVHTAGIDGPDARARALSLLAEVGLEANDVLLAAFPHQLSGGQRQRVCIACALAANPRVLIADEPTTALDATMKRVILELLRRLAKERSLAVWLISHDLRSLHGICDEVTVMYAGRVVEQGAAADVLTHPRHPYTQALLNAVPSATPRGTRLPTIEGQLPQPRDVIPGCRFHPRCERYRSSNDPRCTSSAPARRDGVACHLSGEAP